MVLKRPLQIFNGFWGDHHHWMFFGRSDHCHQWFYDGFLMLLPSLSMVFDGSGPLVKRCDGFDGSLWSNVNHVHHVHWKLPMTQTNWVVYYHFGHPLETGVSNRWKVGIRVNIRGCCDVVNQYQQHLTDALSQGRPLLAWLTNTLVTGLQTAFGN